MGKGKTILIIGEPQDTHAAHMWQALHAAGASPFYLDSRLIPQHVGVSYRADLLQGEADGGEEPPLAQLRWLAEGSEPIDLLRLASVYWRYHHGYVIDTSAIADPFLQQTALRETQSAMQSLFLSLPCRWVNPPQAIEGHRNKAYQLRQIDQCVRPYGCRVPKTLVSNDTETVLAFLDALDGKMIVKPVTGGAHTTPVAREDLLGERAQGLRHAPATFQERIEGTDIRVYWLGEACHAAEIQTPHLDFREDPEARLVPVTLPEPVAMACQGMAHALDYRFTGIDLRRTPDGEYVFFEANPSPMFIHFEAATGHPITQELTHLLLG